MYKDIPYFLRDFLSYLKTIKGLSPNTVHEYYYDLRLYLKFMTYRLNLLDFEEKEIEDIDIRKLKVEDLKGISIIDLHSYISYRDNDRDNSTTTRSRKVSSLRTFYKYLNTVAKSLDENPTLELELPKMKKRNPVYMTFDESKRLLEVIAQEKNAFLRYRDFAIVLLFLTTGIRLSELTSMDTTSLKDLEFTVIGKGNKERIVYMTEAARYAIDQYLMVRPDLEEEKALFLSNRYSRMSNRAVQHMLDKYLAKAGFDTRKYSVHKLRHTAATLMYREGVDIRTLQKVLGHTSVATTQIYTHVADDSIKGAISHNPLNAIKMDEEKSEE
ncbi:tyrosine recombinase XerC [Helcococcus massiliensis]|uniref:tyrosine recombinase XerC n=1 Tax=Helcococcus massiliensis TaxID=2040290 RepID=UPI000CDF2693|nr:tyrosine recombinase XerC [Helcococcus massiliensis]